MSIDMRIAGRELEAARIIRMQISNVADGDEDFIRDTMEGETGLHELIAALCEADATDDALIAGINAISDRISKRKERIAKRRELRRAMIANAMQIAELKKIETPAGAVSIKTVSPRLVVTEESEIPARFFVPQPPKLDKKALADALKDGDEIPGAILSNGSRTIQIRG